MVSYLYMMIVCKELFIYKKYITVIIQVFTGMSISLEPRGLQREDEFL